MLVSAQDLKHGGNIGITFFIPYKANRCQEAEAVGTSHEYNMSKGSQINVCFPTPSKLFVYYSEISTPIVTKEQSQQPTVWASQIVEIVQHDN